MHSIVRTIARLMPGVVVLACMREAPSPLPSSGGPRLVAIDEVVLREDSSTYVGKPSGFAAGPDGSFLISDLSTASVHHYDRDGSWIRDLGRPGRGPGEFSTVTAVAFNGTSLLAVLGGPRLHVLDIATGTSQWATVVRGARDVSISGDTVLYDHINRATRTTMAIVTRTSPTPHRLGPFPEPLGRSEIIDRLFGTMRLARSGDRIALVIQSSDYLFLYSLRDQSTDSIHVAMAGRRGARRDLLDKVTDDDPSVAQEAVYVPSTPWALGWLPSGFVGYVVNDVTPEMTPEGRVIRFAGQAYLSVIDPLQRRTCADAPVPAPAVPQPWIALHSDTLLVLSQLMDDAQQVTTIIRRYKIDTDACVWLDAPASR